MIESQSDAKEFFVEKVITEAGREGVNLTEAEQRMLSWSESDPNFIADPALVEQLASEISDEEYESKVARLLDAAYRRDIAADAGTRREYRRAYEVLSQGDHYLLIMIEQSLGRRLRPWWRFSMT